jgi:hypothetical protein
MPVTSKSHPPPSAVSASIDAFVARKKKRTGQEILELFEMMMAQCGFFESALVCSQGSASCAQRNEWSLLVVSEMVRMQVGRRASQVMWMEWVAANERREVAESDGGLKRRNEGLMMVMAAGRLAGDGRSWPPWGSDYICWMGGRKWTGLAVSVRPALIDKIERKSGNLMTWAW